MALQRADYLLGDAQYAADVARAEGDGVSATVSSSGPRSVAQSMSMSAAGIT